MLLQKLFLICLSVALFGGGYGLARIGAGSIETVGRAETKSRVFEARVYTVNDGKLEALQARMRNQAKLLEKHGITVIGYWVPEDAPASHNTLISIWAYPNREAAKKSLEAFRNDSDRKKLQQESEADGALVKKLDATFMNATDYSPMK